MNVDVIPCLELKLIEAIDTNAACVSYRLQSTDWFGAMVAPR